MIRPIVIILLIASIITLTKAAFSVTELKNLVSNQLLFAGNASASASSTSNLYFLFYGRQGVLDRAQLSAHPTIIAFGNPGSSSQYLNFGGLGPLLITSNLTLVANPNSASQFANLLFIDPLGVGFSFANNTKDIPTSQNGISQQISYALTQIKKNADFGKGKWILLGQSSWIKTASGFQNIDDNLVGVVSLSPWGDMYDIAKYYGVAGVEMGLLSNVEKNTVQSTWTTCYLYIKNGKYAQAHKCFDETLNYVSTKTNNHNLYNINLNFTLIDTFAKVQSYLSQASAVNTFLAPTGHSFQFQSAILQSNIYAEQSQNTSQNISYFMRDYLSAKFLFVSGNSDYITYYKAIRGWLDSLNFMQSAEFKNKAYENVTVGGNVVGQSKSVKQVKYVQLQNCGHYIYFDQTAVINSLLKDWVGTLSNYDASSLMEQ